jgi:hypothetical protein
MQGAYQFELKVTDAGGLFSKDTVQITVMAADVVHGCGSPRPSINAQLIPVGTLSEARLFMSAVANGNKIFFAGGSMSQIWTAPYASTRVDIYHVVAKSWTTAELSKPRWQMATVAAGSKVFFAGGGYYDDGDNAIDSKNVDIYDISTNQWSVASLSAAKHDMAAATVGHKVFFAGGMMDDMLDSISKTIDIYDLATNTWSTAELSEPKTGLTAVTTNNKVYFAGGIKGWNSLPNSSFEWVASNKIDVYDNATNTWSTSSMNESRYYAAGINVNDKIYWAGGPKTNPGSMASSYRLCSVEIENINDQTSSVTYLSRPRDLYVNAGQNAVLKDDNIVFFTGARYFGYGNSNQFDIYNVTTKTWQVGVLPVSIEGASVISVNNIIYVAGGRVNGTFSN